MLFSLKIYYKDVKHELTIKLKTCSSYIVESLELN